MEEKSKVIFGNVMSDKVYKSAVKSKKKFIKKFGDDSNVDYPIYIQKNEHIGDSLGVYDILLKEGDSPEEFDHEKGIIVGNIRMGFGHYRISMAMASAAKAMGYTPYWMDLNGYPLKIADLLAQLDGTCYVTRQSVHSPAAVRKAKAAIKKAFQNSIDKKGTSLVEIVSTCNSGWKLSPAESNKWMEENMFPFYPLGDLKNKE